MSAAGKGAAREGAPLRLRLAVLGASGRMGRLTVEAASRVRDIELVASIDPSLVQAASVDPSFADASAEGEPHPRDGERPRRIAAALSELRPGDLDAAVEFTRGEAPASIAPQILRIGCAWVCGTTGLTKDSREALDEAARKVPVLLAPNLSLGAALLGRLCGTAARLLPEGWALEIVETHHAAKLDAPSGTALHLGDLWTRERGGRIVHGRTGRTGPRPDEEVGIHAVRLPEGVGEHRILLGGPAEMLELTHRALDRRAFAEGALVAARWLAGKPPRLYGLEDWVEERLARRAAAG